MPKFKFVLIIALAIGLIVSACGGAQTAAPQSTSPSAATAAPAATSAPATVTAPAATAAPEATSVLSATAAGKVVLHFGWQLTPDSLNPAVGVLFNTYRLYDLIYNPLITEAPDGSYVGALAKSWTHTDDGLTWTFTLKDNIKWHDAAPFTADDMAWAINAIHNDPKGWATLTNYTNGFKEIKALDPRTVQIVLDAPISNMEYRVSFLYAIRRQDFEGFKTPEDLQNFPNDKPIGTGLFMLKTFDKDKGLVILEANPNYFGGRSKVDELIFQTFDNSDALVQALKAGDVDAITAVPAAAFQTVKGFDNVKAVNVTSRSFDELIINSAPDTNKPKPTGNPALKDPAVRLAIAQAINKKDLVDIVWQGLAKPGDSIVAPTLRGGFWHNANIQDVGFDLKQANQTLQAAGYELGADGVRSKGKVRLEMRLQYDASSAEYARAADSMKNWFAQIGLKVTPEAVNSDSLTAATTGVGDYDLVIWGWTGDPDPDFILSIMLCDQFAVGGWSDSGYCNPDYDKLYLDQQKAVDPAARQQIIYKMQELLFRDKPYIVLYNYDSLQAYRSDRFKNYIDNSPSVEIESAFSLSQVEPVK
jgi:peptide/nickel transport system substrate-binding protein